MTGEISVTEIIFIPYEHNFPDLFTLYKTLHHRGKLHPVSGKTFLHMNRTTLFDLSKCFLGNRDNFCPYELALRRTTEWCLNKQVFQSACDKFNTKPNIDLFASRINSQIKPYMSYSPDPEAFAVNAFHHSWVGYNFYAFPPFCLQKIRKEESERLVIQPKWTTQSWWPVAMKMLTQTPVILPRKTSTLFLPSNPLEKHPLHDKLILLMCHLSGNIVKTDAFRQQLLKHSKQHGEQVRENNMRDTWKSGDSIVVHGMWIPFRLLYRKE